jgi:hypothetical protein
LPSGWVRGCRDGLSTPNHTSAVFASKHEARLEGRNYVLSGKKDLGKFGGVFEFTGTATPQEFHAKYRAKMDHGEFEMKRPSAP